MASKVVERGYYRQEELQMRYTRLIALLAVPVLFASLGWAQEGESIYKSKCSTCHGPTAEGKIGPSLKTTKLNEDDIVLLLSKGNDARKVPHKKGMSSLTDDQIKAVAHFVKSLK
jgi:mono/diheme cytochrome c family protein